MARRSVFGWVVNYVSLVPLVGEAVMRLRNFLIMKSILQGGVADAENIPPALLKEMYGVGNRPGRSRAFLSLLRNSKSWEAATKDYGRIEVPVMLHLGGPGLGEAVRTRARSHADKRRRDDDAQSWRAFFGARQAGRSA